MHRRFGFRSFQEINVAVVALFAMLTVTSTAWAHDIKLVRSEPAAGSVIDQSPPQILAQFEEEVQPKVSSLQIVNEDGKAIDDYGSKLDLNDVEHATLLLPINHPVPNGHYYLHWRVTLLDGDVAVGQFGFTVGKNAALPRTVNQARVTTNADALAATTSDKSALANFLTTGPRIWIAIAIAIVGLLVISGVILATHRRLN